MEVDFKIRKDLIGREGTITKSFKILDAREYPAGIGVDVRVADSMGEEYWTTLDNLDIQE